MGWAQWAGNEFDEQFNPYHFSTSRQVANGETCKCQPALNCVIWEQFFVHCVFLRTDRCLFVCLFVCLRARRREGEKKSPRISAYLIFDMVYSHRKCFNLLLFDSSKFVFVIELAEHLDVKCRFKMKWNTQQRCVDVWESGVFSSSFFLVGCVYYSPGCHARRLSRISKPSGDNSTVKYSQNKNWRFSSERTMERVRARWAESEQLRRKENENTKRREWEG